MGTCSLTPKSSQSGDLRAENCWLAACVPGTAVSALNELCGDFLWPDWPYSMGTFVARRLFGTQPSNQLQSGVQSYRRQRGKEAKV
mmetsp:Transcript_56849/g.101439  ORF Transcript_56849/g.101439 Transcript_56849/m.101439 type:complete len:86 (+) Transcript_56849:243-500(+)